MPVFFDLGDPAQPLKLQQALCENTPFVSRAISLCIAFPAQFWIRPGTVPGRLLFTLYVCFKRKILILGPP